MTIRASSSGTALVAGGAGFLGSHLCGRLIAEGWRLICVDNLHTGTVENLGDLSRESRFSLIEMDIVKPLPDRMRVDRIYNLACPASPPHYQADPVHTLLTNVLGMRNLLELARSSEARILQTSTSEVYGDPAQHPQTEAYWGNVNPIGVRACYDEGSEQRDAVLRLPAAAPASACAWPACSTHLVHRHDIPIADVCVWDTVVRAMNGKPLTIYGSGEPTRSLCPSI